jgi:hypothetical protein
MSSYLKLDDFEKNLIEEISILSGYTPTIVRDVLESTFMRQLESLMSRKEIQIPFIGKIKVNHIGEEWIAGTRSSKIEVFVSPSDLLKRFVGEIQDGDSPTINSLMQKKIKGVLQSILDNEKR